MKATLFVIAASAMCLASAAQARMPVFLEIDGVKGETEKRRPKPQSAPAQEPGRAIAAPRASQRGGVNVAAGDVDGDGRADAALLLPAPQKARVADRAGTNAPAAGNAPPPTPPPPRLNKSSSTVIRIDHHASETGSGANGTPRNLTRGGRGEAGLLLPAVQKVRATEPAQGNPAPRHIRQGTMTTRKQGGSGD